VRGFPRQSTGQQSAGLYKPVDWVTKKVAQHKIEGEGGRGDGGGEEFSTLFSCMFADFVFQSTGG